MALPLDVHRPARPAAARRPAIVAAPAAGIDLVVFCAGIYAPMRADRLRAWPWRCSTSR
jgi:hypothetical protein